MKSKQKQKNITIFIGILIFSGILFLLPFITKAADSREPEVRIYNATTLKLEKKFVAYDQGFNGGFSIASCDVNGDGYNEIVTGAGPGGGPSVRIFDRFGQIEFTPGFYAYDESFRGGINIACGDLDNDGSAEIITAPKFGGGPYIRIFDRFGNPKFTMGFFAYDESFRGGVNIAVGDIDGGGLKDIITAPGPGGGPQVRVFNRLGRSLNKDFFSFHPDFKGGVSLAAADVDGDKIDEIITAVQNYDVAWVKTTKLAQTNSVLGQFLAFPKDFKNGVNVSAGDIDGDGHAEIIASVQTNASPQVRAFEVNGAVKPVNFFAYENDFKGGVYTAVADLDNDGVKEIITAPSKRITEGRTDLQKYIDVDISEQKMQYFENGYKIGEYPVSSGKASMPTPLGTFHIKNKALVAYSKEFALYMPYWMQFTSAGHGLHGLPYWKLKNGGIIYEGVNHLGRRVSHGCVRLPVAGAVKVFAWADVGTTVIIHN